jgi:GAF domain-containing protein
MVKVAASNTLRLHDAGEPLDGEPPVEAFKELGAHLRALQAATTALAQLRTVERLATVAAAAARDGLDAEVLLVAILDDDGRRLRSTLVGALGTEARQPASIPADGPSLLAQVARSGRPIFQHSSPDAGRDQTCHAITRLRPGTEAVAALPLPGTHGPLGVIVLRRSGHRGFSADDIAFLTVLAGLCALAVERLRLSTDRSHVREILRRQLVLQVAGTQLRVGRMHIDLEQLQIEVDGRSANLTPTEIRLLMFLAQEPGRPRTRREILRHLWHTDYVGGERACDAHIWNLRRKIEREPSRPELVVTRRGVGYALDVA